jgi:hypothetical protein
MPDAVLSFLPWVRQGAAAAITVEDTLGASRLPPVAAVAAALTLNGAPLPTPPVTLRGPADVVGIDANQVVRTDPRPDTADFEPNCFASIEFDRPDFPWLFTPAKANSKGQLRPWLCLVVVEKRAGVTLTAAVDGPLSTLRIAASPAAELPDLKESWAWAHAQVAADLPTEAALRAALAGGPQRTLSRLLCPRFLAPETEYIACVVPTFELGRRAGLGLPVSDQDLDPASGVLAPAWSLAPAPAEVLLPVYYRWEFRTGQQGDFESLARRLRTGVPAGLGTRRIDISRPGFPASGATTVELEGALLPIPPAGSPPPADPVPPSFRTTLASILNGPSAVHTPGQPPALLAPPTYGRWHAGATAVSPARTTWLEQLNLDPRWRVAAALGTRVVQEHQEALMASAWEQAAELEAANQRLRQLQLGLAVGETLHRRHFAVLSEEQMLRVAAPAFGRLRQDGGASMLALQTGSALPVGATRSAMRRIGRLRGPLSRRVAAKAAPRSATDTWVARLNLLPSATPAPPPPPPPPREAAPIPALLEQAVQRLDEDDTRSSFGVFFVAAEIAPVTQPGTPVVDTTRTEVPEFFRTAARDHWTRFFPASPVPSRPFLVGLRSVRDLVLSQTRPHLTLATLARAVVSTGDGVLAPTAPGIAPLGVETVMAGPRFPQPMYEPLRELSQQLLLPGLETVEADTVLGLATNRRFVEAYMVGLNHEMGRELLWRGYPTDQRGTYFDHFWGLGVPNAAPSDINDLVTWRTRQLGSPAGAPALDERFVMVIRSSLLGRYPNAAIYLTPAVHPGTPPDPNRLAADEDPEHEQLPLFTGSLQPDVAFFGFAVATAAATGADGGLGHYVVIQEHPTEPRFGLDADFPRGGASHLAVAAGGPAARNAAEMAARTRRLPVRIAIHAARLMTHA